LIGLSSTTPESVDDGIEIDVSAENITNGAYEELIASPSKNRGMFSGFNIAMTLPPQNVSLSKLL
jgi:hypothetical protein